MKTSYDRKHDVAYVEFSAADSERQAALDDARIIDYAADGSVVGVEFISPSRGVNLAGVPRAAEVNARSGASACRSAWRRPTSRGPADAQPPAGLRSTRRPRSSGSPPRTWW